MLLILKPLSQDPLLVRTAHADQLSIEDKSSRNIALIRGCLKSPDFWVVDIKRKKNKTNEGGCKTWREIMHA